jgi:hypothetical protein
VINAIAAATTAMILAAAPAHADGPKGAGPDPHAPQGTGYLYAWEAADHLGRSCWWFNASTNWDYIAGNSLNACSDNSRASIRNKASSVWNDGNSGNPVNLYIHPGYTGAWTCIGAGVAWTNLQNHNFNYGAGRDGYGDNSNDNIASHRWRSYCGAA